MPKAHIPAPCKMYLFPECVMSHRDDNLELRTARQEQSVLMTPPYIPDASLVRARECIMVQDRMRADSTCTYKSCAAFDSVTMLCTVATTRGKTGCQQPALGSLRQLWSRPSQCRLAHPSLQECHQSTAPAAVAAQPSAAGPAHICETYSIWYHTDKRADMTSMSMTIFSF